MTCFPDRKEGLDKKGRRSPTASKVLLFAANLVPEPSFALKMKCNGQYNREICQHLSFESSCPMEATPKLVPVASDADRVRFTPAASEVNRIEDIGLRYGLGLIGNPNLLLSIRFHQNLRSERTAFGIGKKMIKSSLNCLIK